jgi:arylsulfatase A-like enzyme
MEHRQVTKSSAYEGSVRVPLIARGPGVEAGRRVDTLVSLVDIYPTLMDMASASPARRLDGISLMPALSGRSTGHPGWVLSEYHDATCCASYFLLRQGDWKYVRYVGFDPQLFNLADDPWEVHDQAAAETARTAEMDRMLRGIVDYQAVAAKVAAYDRASFRRWRAEQQEAGQYGPLMARVFSGWNHFTDEAKEIRPWTRKDEERIERWLAEA